MVKTAEQSVSAELTASTILTYITSVKLDDGKWRGTSKDFIIHWCEQVRLLESLTKPEDHFGDTVKTHLLQNTIDGVPDFWQVRTVTQQTYQASAPVHAHTFEEYKALLLDAATIYDDKHAARRRPTRGTFLHDFQTFALTGENGGVWDTYDIDTDIATIYANAADQVRIPSDRFSQMTPTGRQLW
jgi:hypothetical protein